MPTTEPTFSPIPKTFWPIAVLDNRFFNMGRYTGKISIRNLADQNRNNDNSGNEYNIYK